MTNTCLDCGAKIDKRSKRCRSCAGEAQAQDPEWQRKHSAGLEARRSRGGYGKEWRGKMSAIVKAAYKRGVYGEEWRQKISLGMKVVWQDPDYRQRYYEAMAEPELRRRMSEKLRAAWARGDFDDGERLRKISERMKARWQDPQFRAAHSGENCNFWREGASQKCYPPEFDEALKQAVRERDGFICILCGEPQNGRALDVHHIDGDKQNSAMANLVSLHRSCHMTVHASSDFDAYRVGFQALFSEVNNEAETFR